jgi:hypothetical protein
VKICGVLWLQNLRQLYHKDVELEIAGDTYAYSPEFLSLSELYRPIRAERGVQASRRACLTTSPHDVHRFVPPPWVIPGSKSRGDFRESCNGMSLFTVLLEVFESFSYFLSISEIFRLSVLFRYVSHLEKGVSTVIVLITTSSLMREIVGALYFLDMLPLYEVMVPGMTT